ncbi:MAG TPA: phage major capsid protein, partial [Terriglobales bacterium]|nr:phage major capsid protein [Terriglobales bacterium]
PVSFPRQTAVSVATMKAETQAADQSDVTLDQVSMSPKRGTVYTSYTVDLLRQTTMDVESWVRDDLGKGIAELIDYMALTSNGVAPNPGKGLFASPTGINTKAYVATDSTTKTQSVIGLETECAIDNADTASASLIATPEVRGMWKGTPWLGNSSGISIWQGAGENQTVNGYKAFVSNQVPKTLGAGTNEHGVVFGDFSQLMIGFWDALEIIVDPYTKAKEAIYEITARQYYDIGLRHPKAFCVQTGVTIS